MKKIVIIPEHIYEKWDGKKFLEVDRTGVKIAFDAFLKYYGKRNDFICEYYFRNALLGGKEISKASCNSNGEITVISTGCFDMVSVISGLSKNDVKNSWFFIDIWSDESNSFGNSLDLADIVIKSTNNFIFFNKVGGDELYMREFNDDKRSFVDEIESKYKGLPAEFYYQGDYFSMLRDTKEYYLDSNKIKFDDSINSDELSNLKK